MHVTVLYAGCRLLVLAPRQGYEWTAALMVPPASQGVVRCGREATCTWVREYLLPKGEYILPKGEYILPLYHGGRGTSEGGGKERSRCPPLFEIRTHYAPL